MKKKVNYWLKQAIETFLLLGIMTTLVLILMLTISTMTFKQCLAPVVVGTSISLMLATFKTIINKY